MLLSLGTVLRNSTPPPTYTPFWPKTDPGFAISKFTAPSFRGSSQDSPFNFIVPHLGIYMLIQFD